MTSHSTHRLIVEDPPHEPMSSRYRNLVELARSQEPGTWGRIATYPAATTARDAVRNLRNGKARVPAGRWEFKSGQINGRGKHGVWAKYLGPATDTD